MKMRTGFIAIFKNNKHYIQLGALLVLSYMLFQSAYLFQEEFHRFMDVATYLTWHNLFEFTGCLVSFAVFIVAYYTYDQTKNLKFMFLGSLFLTVGLIDVFHTLSFKGMPAFFIENDTANRATTYWILSRMILGVGLVITGLLPATKKLIAGKWLFVLCPLVLCAVILVVPTYYPGFLPSMYIEGTGLTCEKVFAEYIIVVLLILTIFLYLREYQKTKDSINVTFCMALLLNIFSEFAFISYVGVYDIYNYIGHIYKFIGFFIIFRITFVFNVQKPYLQLTEAQNELRNHAENLDRMVEHRTLQLKVINQKLIDDLEYAKDIQKSLLPTRLPEEAGVSFDAKYFPAERVSGDLYNIFKLDDKHIGMYIGDVCGHGVSAAMLTVFLNQSVKAVRELHDNSFEILKPAEVLMHIYNSFNKTNFKDDMYFVMLYGVYNFETRVLTYGSAGMNVQPLLIRNSKEVLPLEIKGFPICKFMNELPICYTNTSLQLHPGDRVFFQTDGLVEAENSDKEHFGEKRLIKILEKNFHRPDNDLCEEVSNHLFDFIGNNQLKDDVTFFLMNVK